VVTFVNVSQAGKDKDAIRPLVIHRVVQEVLAMLNLHVTVLRDGLVLYVTSLNVRLIAEMEGAQLQTTAPVILDGVENAVIFLFVIHNVHTMELALHPISVSAILLVPMKDVSASILSVLLDAKITEDA